MRTATAKRGLLLKAGFGRLDSPIQLDLCIDVEDHQARPMILEKKEHAEGVF